MRLFNSITEIKELGSPKLALTIGNFDGVHLGHQQLIRYLKTQTHKNGLELAVITFVPHPKKILHSHAERFLLGSYEQRRQWLSEGGVDHLIEIPFTRDFSTQGPVAFLEAHVLSYDSLKALYLGHDFAFGANKQGDAEVVKRHCQAKDLVVEICPSFQVDGHLVSSTLIREALLRGQISPTQKMLGRSYSLEGVVVKGEGRGRKIGIPTANLQIDPDILVPARGVYVTQSLCRGKINRSVTNVGHNPTFEADKALTVETHLIDFSDDLYGETLEVRFLARIRDEKRFPSVDELIAQLQADVVTGREYQLD